MAALELSDAALAAIPEGRTPDLWSLLDAGVCREPGRGGRPDAKGRVAVADSKRLKLSNAVRSTHPLIHLERGVLAFLRQRWPAETADTLTDAALFDLLGVASPWHACYDAPPVPLPLSQSQGELAIASGVLAGALARAGVSVATLACDVTPEPRFNAIIRDAGNKAETVVGALGRHLCRLWAQWMDPAVPGRRLGIACDRLGGRTQYAPLLEDALPGVRAHVVDETPLRSRYTLEHPSGAKAGITFAVEGESAHLPVALASMTAKLTRELLMRRFNAYWTAHARDLHGLELKPTAGYALDARRWITDADAFLSPADRHALIRIA